MPLTAGNAVLRAKHEAERIEAAKKEATAAAAAKKPDAGKKAQAKKDKVWEQSPDQFWDAKEWAKRDTRVVKASEEVRRLIRSKHAVGNDLDGLHKKLDEMRKEKKLSAENLAERRREISAQIGEIDDKIHAVRKRPERPAATQDEEEQECAADVTEAEEAESDPKWQLLKEMRSKKAELAASAKESRRLQKEWDDIYREEFKNAVSENIKKEFKDVGFDRESRELWSGAQIRYMKRRSEALAVEKSKRDRLKAAVDSIDQKFKKLAKEAEQKAKDAAAETAKQRQEQLAKAQQEGSSGMLPGEDEVADHDQEGDLKQRGKTGNGKKGKSVLLDALFDKKRALEEERRNIGEGAARREEAKVVSDEIRALRERKDLLSEEIDAAIKAKEELVEKVAEEGQALWEMREKERNAWWDRMSSREQAEWPRMSIEQRDAKRKAMKDLVAAERETKTAGQKINNGALSLAGATPAQQQDATNLLGTNGETTSTTTTASDLWAAMQKKRDAWWWDMSEEEREAWYTLSSQEKAKKVTEVKLRAMKMSQAAAVVVSDDAASTADSATAWQ